MLLLCAPTVSFTWMMFVAELQLRYMKSSTIPIAIIHSLLPVFSDIWGLLCLLHSCIYTLFNKWKALSLTMWASNCNPYLQIWTFHNWTCTVKPIFICDNCINGLLLQLPKFCRCFDLLGPVVRNWKLLKTVRCHLVLLQSKHDFFKQYV